MVSIFKFLLLVENSLFICTKKETQLLFVHARPNVAKMVKQNSFIRSFHFQAFSRTFLRRAFFIFLKEKRRRTEKLILHFRLYYLVARTITRYSVFRVDYRTSSFCPEKLAIRGNFYRIFCFHTDETIRIDR